MTTYQEQLIDELRGVTDRFLIVKSPADPDWSRLQYRLAGITSALYRTGLTQQILDDLI